MRLNSFEDDTTYTPRSERVSFDLAARYRHGTTRTRILLQNLSLGGARAEGLGDLRCGDRITLLLPSLKPKVTMVVWSVGDIFGLEFERPLHPDIYETLVLHHAQWRERTDLDHQLQVNGKDYSAPVDDLRKVA